MNKFILSLLLLILSTSSWTEGYYISYGKSVGCPKHTPIPSDVNLEKTDNIIRLTSAPSRGGVFLGVIGAKQYPFIDNSYYTVSGWFRKSGGHPEQIDINLQYIENYFEHYAEIIWSLNPSSPLYEKVWTRNPEPVILFELKDDYKWHYFELVVYHGDYHIVKSIQVDNNYIEIHHLMGTVKKDYEEWFGIILETQNTYTNCNSLIQTSGASEWKYVSLRYGN